MEVQVARPGAVVCESPRDINDIFSPHMCE